MIKTAIVGITALTAVLLIAPPQGRAEAPAVRPPFSEAAGNRDGESAAIRPGEKLTVDRCVQVALRNSPDILVAFHTVNATRSQVGQAWSGYYPEITLSGRYGGRNSPAYVSPNTFVPVRQDGFTGSATLKQNISDFGKTGATVSFRQRNLDASQEDLRDQTGQIVFNVKKAYYGLLRAEKKRDVLRETLSLSEKQLEQAKGFFEAGMKPRFDVTSAEVDLSNAKLNLIRAENELRFARVTLNNAMGVPDAREYMIEDTLPFQKYPITLEEARDRAFLNRPDIRAAVARRQASEEALSFARMGNYPTLTGNANVTKVGGTLPPEQDSWSVGVVLSVPFFSGFLTTHQVGEAKENLSVNKAREEAVRQKVYLTVQKAHFDLLDAEERLGVAELAVKQNEENYELAHAKYEAGAGSPIEETKALVDLSNARMSVIDALTDYKIAEAELRNAMGE